MSLPVGYFPCTQDPPAGENVARMIDEIVEQAQACERAGFDGFYFTEHHQQEDAYLPAPVLMAGLVGMKTERIRVGTCVLLAPLYHPIRLAEDISVVDQATKGRMVVAMGIGYQPPDFGAFGVTPSERAEFSPRLEISLPGRYVRPEFPHRGPGHDLPRPRRRIQGKCAPWSRSRRS